MKQIEIDQMSIGYQEKGSGQTLVFLHGGVSDSRFWNRELEAFSDEFHTIAWDAPGCGVSDDPEAGSSLSDYADTLAGLLAKVGVEKPIILGISFGGGLAIEFYNRHPDIPKALILVSAYAGWAGSLSDEEVARRLEKGRAQSTMDPEEVSEMWIPSLFYKTPSKEIFDETKEIISDFHPIGTQVMLEAFAEADLRGALPKIDIPTLLLYGEKDVRSPKSVANEIHNLTPNSNLVFFEGVGHLVNKEAPEAFDQEVRNFIDILTNN
jgi:pimeloyl-ACP methyl ester carboxylesterase